jgi:hypothetical protein
MWECRDASCGNVETQDFASIQACHSVLDAGFSKNADGIAGQARNEAALFLEVSLLHDFARLPCLKIRIQIICLILVPDTS